MTMKKIAFSVGEKIERMGDFAQESLGITIQRAESGESLYDIQLGNTIGDRDWAWENICSEKEILEKSLQSKIDELQQLQIEHEDLKERLVENERQTRKVQEDLEKQMDHTQKLIARLTQEKQKNVKLEEEKKNIAQIEGEMNNIKDKNDGLEHDINTLNVLVQKCLEELNIEKTKSRFLGQMYDRKESALKKEKEKNRKLENKLSILTGSPGNRTDDDEELDNKRFKRKRIQECKRCHKALVPDEITGNCCFHSRKPVHYPQSDDPKMMIWQCCHQKGRVEPTGCQSLNYHEPL